MVYGAGLDDGRGRRQHRPRRPADPSARGAARETEVSDRLAAGGGAGRGRPPGGAGRGDRRMPSPECGRRGIVTGAPGSTAVAVACAPTADRLARRSERWSGDAAADPAASPRPSRPDDGRGRRVAGAIPRRDRRPSTVRRLLRATPGTATRDRPSPRRPSVQADRPRSTAGAGPWSCWWCPTAVDRATIDFAGTGRRACPGRCS